MPTHMPRQCRLIWSKTCWGASPRYNCTNLRLEKSSKTCSGDILETLSLPFLDTICTNRELIASKRRGIWYLFTPSLFWMISGSGFSSNGRLHFPFFPGSMNSSFKALLIVDSPIGPMPGIFFTRLQRSETFEPLRSVSLNIARGSCNEPFPLEPSLPRRRKLDTHPSPLAMLMVDESHWQSPT